MPLQNVQPLPSNFTWSSATPAATQEMITTYNAEELDVLNLAPEPEIAWANVGTNVSIGSGIVKVPWRIPQSMAYGAFNYGGNRQYQNIDIAAPAIKVMPWDLNFAWPMVWDEMGRAKLMSEGAPDESGRPSLMEFAGAGGLADAVIGAARAYKAQLVSSMFFLGYTSSALGLTATIKTVPQPGLPNGNAFFTNGSDTPAHYSHPFNGASGTFKNAWTAYGAFASNFKRSLVAVSQVPHPTLPNQIFGARVTDVIGPTWMRDRFWDMAVSSLSLQTTTTPGNLAAATTNTLNAALLQQYSVDNFIGAAGLGPVRYWINPALDAHPYFTANSNANMTTGPGGGPAAEIRR